MDQARKDTILGVIGQVNDGGALCGVRGTHPSADNFTEPANAEIKELYDNQDASYGSTGEGKNRGWYIPGHAIEAQLDGI